MDQNLNNERIVGFLGQSYVLIPRKVLEMLFRGEGRERSVGMVYLSAPGVSLMMRKLMKGI